MAFVALTPGLNFRPTPKFHAAAWDDCGGRQHKELVELWGLLIMQVRVTPVVEGADITEVMWMHRDMTDVQEQQRMLQLRSRVLNCMSDGIFIADCSGCLMHTNQGFAKLTGYLQSEAVGRPWTFLLVHFLTTPCHLCCTSLFPLLFPVLIGRTEWHCPVSFPFPALV